MTGAGNSTWLIDGAVPTLIDAGIGTPAHVSAIRRALGARALVRVLVTHHHPDHASGVSALRAAFPSLEACKLPLRGEAGWRALADGDTVPAGDGRVTVVHTPGHAPDHICLWDVERRHLYAGDMVQEGGTVMIPFGRGGSLRDYLRSLERLVRLAPERIFPGHGGVIERPIEVLASYIEHRRMRERQIQACLAEGLTAVEAIVARLYPDLPAALGQPARLTVEAHLEKLREDGDTIPSQLG
jgi:glyoxylase-like metal-dependent hydrolase (beta-lactamase superfamily II)